MVKKSEHLRICTKSYERFADMNERINICQSPLLIYVIMLLEEKCTDLQQYAFHFSFRQLTTLFGGKLVFIMLCFFVCRPKLEHQTMFAHVQQV